MAVPLRTVLMRPLLLAVTCVALAVLAAITYLSMKSQSFVAVQHLHGEWDVVDVSSLPAPSRPARTVEVASFNFSGDPNFVVGESVADILSVPRGMTIGKDVLPAFSFGVVHRLRGMAYLWRGATELGLPCTLMIYRSRLFFSVLVEGTGIRLLSLSKVGGPREENSWTRKLKFAVAILSVVALLRFISSKLSPTPRQQSLQRKIEMAKKRRLAESARGASYSEQPAAEKSTSARLKEE